MEKNTEFQVYLLQVVSKELEKLHKETQKQINDQLKELVDPTQVRSKKLKGSENTYRLRVGKYRVAYRKNNARYIKILTRWLDYSGYNPSERWVALP